MPKKWNLTNILYNETSTFDYGMSYENDDGDTIQIYDSDLFAHKIAYKYTSWCLTSPCFWDTENKEWIDICNTMSDAISLLHSVYDAWREDRLPGYAKLYEALRSKYNPIYNVDVVTGHVEETTNTGTDTLTKRGTDTTKLSGTDTTAASGNDVTRAGGRDVDTKSGTDTTRLSGTDTTRLSGTDSERHTGTVTEGHTGTISTAKNVTKDDISYKGSELDKKAGKETTTDKVWTFDDAAEPHNANASVTEYPPIGSSDARADIHEYSSRVDEHRYNDVITETLNNTDTTTNNTTDATTYGKQDATTYGKTETYQHGAVDTVDYGKTETLQHGKTDTTTYGKQDQTTHNTTDTSTKDLLNRHIELEIKQGNQGTTMTQQMLQAQIDLTARDSIIDMMIADFVHTNCII